MGRKFIPLKRKNNRIEYASLINIKPSQDNFSIAIQNRMIRAKIDQIIKKLISINNE